MRPAKFDICELLPFQMLCCGCNGCKYNSGAEGRR